MIILEGGEGSSERVQRRRAYRRGRQPLVAVRVVGRIRNEIFHRKIEGGASECVEKYCVDLKGHASVESLPENASYHPSVLVIFGFPFQDRCHRNNLLSRTCRGSML